MNWDRQVLPARNNIIDQAHSLRTYHDVVEFRRLWALPVLETIHEKYEGIDLSTKTYWLSRARFTNITHVHVPSSRRISVCICNDPKSVKRFRQEQGAIIGVSGTFTFISDTPYKPRSNFLDLTVNHGQLSSFPGSSQQACLVISDNHANIISGNINCQFAIDGSSKLYETQFTTEFSPRFQLITSSTCKIEYQPDELTKFKRYVNPLSNLTDRHQNVVDYVLNINKGYTAKISAVIPGGGVDIFSDDAILRDYQSKDDVVLPVGTKLNFKLSLNDIVLDQRFSILTIGPDLASVVRLIQGNNPYNHLAYGKTPFGDSPNSRVFVSTNNSGVDFWLFDGAPDVPEFCGVTPFEAASILSSEYSTSPEKVFFLDGGQSSRISTPHFEIGSGHYLSWPSSRAETFDWIGSEGRPLNTAIIVR